MCEIHQYLLVLLVDIFIIYPKAMLTTGDEKERQVHLRHGRYCMFRKHITVLNFDSILHGIRVR